MIMSEKAQFDLALRLRNDGATIAEVFTFLSGLYFRGKIAYAKAFARPAAGGCGVFVITPTRGLIDANTHITLNDLHEFAEVDIDEDDPRYRKPLQRDARRLLRSRPARPSSSKSNQTAFECRRWRHTPPLLEAPARPLPAGPRL